MSKLPRYVAIFFAIVSFVLVIPLKQGVAFERPKFLPPLQTVDEVDLNRYDGLWYEVAKTKNLFAFGCVCTTATYKILNPTSISVFNSCNRFSANGELSTINGVASVTDTQTNSKLEVNFEGVPFPGTYWIVDLVESDPQQDYTYAVVSEPSRRSVFILSRTPNANPITLGKIYTQLQAQFFDIKEIIPSPQPQGCVYPKA